MIRAAVALGALTLAAPTAKTGSDIRSAARALAPPGARIVVAEELSWDRGVSVWLTGRNPTAVAFTWTHRRWRPAGGTGVHVSWSRPRHLGRVVHESVHVTMLRPLLDALLWVDGRRVDTLFFPSTTRGATAAFTVTLRPGRHVFAAYAAVSGAAVAKAWIVVVR